MLALMASIACGSSDAAAPAAAAAPKAAAAAPKAAAAAAPAAAAKAAAPAASAAAAPKATAVPTARPVVAAAVSGPKKGGHLKWTNQASIGSLDPTRNTSFVTATLVGHWYDFIFTWDSDLIATEQMIDDWSMNADATEYSFTLRDGLAFHTGAPVTSDDVLASIERWRTQVGTPGVMWDLAKPTTSKVDDKTFKVSPTQPFGLWVDYWAQDKTNIIPKATLDATGEEETLTDYTGSGPFQHVEWDPGARNLVKRNEAYVPRNEPKDGMAGGRIALLDSFEVLEVPDAATRVAALQTKQVDFTEGLPNDFFGTVSADANLKVHLIPNWAIPNMATNKLWPPLNNPKSRLAILLMTDPAEYMAAGYGDAALWNTCGAIYFCGSTWATDAHTDNYWNVDKAKAQILWDEAVAESGFEGKMVLLTNTDYSDFYAAALITKRILEELGAEVDFVVTDWATVISRKIANLDKSPQDGGWHIYHSWGGFMDPIGDPRIGKSWNGGWGNERGYKLVEDFSKAKSKADAEKIVDEIQRIYLTEDPPNINYGSFSFLMVMQQDVMDYQPFRNVNIEGVWLDR